MSEPLAYFISFRAYGTWVHGDARGSVNRWRNRRGEPLLEVNEEMERDEQERMKGPAFELDEGRRVVVEKTIREVSAHRGWTIHALSVRSNHVHVVVQAEGVAAEKVMNDLKGWATRRLREAGMAKADARVWSRHGSTPQLYESDDVLTVVDYVMNRQ